MELVDNIPITGVLWAKFTGDNNLESLTHFTTDQLSTTFQQMSPFITAVRSRRPKPKSSWMDMILCYLIWLVYGADIDILAKLLGMKSNRLEDNISRIRPLLNQTLKAKWWDSRQRPVPLMGSRYPHAALLWDHHTSQTFRPKCPFEEAKIYWDGKNKVYGVKNGVGLLANNPHYCMFVTKHQVGSTHDYEDLKHNYHLTLDYLLKLPAENSALPGDVQHKMWSVICDRGYVGQEHDTPGFICITPKKGHCTPAELVTNTEISNLRVPIECFFGRQWKLFGVARNIYRWDHKHFDMDFENMCLLCNDHIEQHQLTTTDAEFYRNAISLRVTELSEKQQKEVESQQRAKVQKKAKLQDVHSVVPF